MDFVVNLPAFHGNAIIMVGIDRFAKVGHSWMLPAHFTTCKAVKLFTTMICKVNGYPNSITLDREIIFE